jgi:hypothetical protein
MDRVLRFHDAVYTNHRSTFWSFPLKEQPDDQHPHDSGKARKKGSLSALEPLFGKTVDCPVTGALPAHPSSLFGT